MTIDKEAVSVKEMVNFPNFFSFIEETTDDEVEEAILMENFYVAGMAAHRSVKGSKCQKCIGFFVESKGKEVGDEYFDYLQRGGLIQPTVTLMTVLKHFLKVFAGILKSNEYTKIFFSAIDQKHVLIELAKTSLCNDDVGINYEDACEKGHTLTQMFERCFSIFANVILNNYCKNINDNVTENCSRKLKKLM